MTHQPPIQGMRIRTLNLILLTASVILFFMVLYTTAQVARDYRESVSATNDYISWEKAAHTLHVGSDYLTEEARLYIQTHKREYADNYFKELYSTRSRERALDSLAGGGVAELDQQELRHALALSNALTDREIYAIRLAAEASGQDLAFFPASVRNIRLSPADKNLDKEAKTELARELMFRPEYSESKKEIMGAIAQFLDQNLARTRQVQEQRTEELGQTLARQRLVLAILCMLNILTFVMIIVLIVKPLRIYLNCIKDNKMLELVGAYEFKHLALTYNDIYALKEHHQKMLQYKAEHDPLTGLMNRAAYDAISGLLKNMPEPLGLALVDVDRFKGINDTYGHIVGDKTLCRVAGLLRGAFRADDFCIRMGGDEFAVIFRNMAPDMEVIVCEKIAAINSALQEPADGLPPTSLSVGVAFSEHGFSDDLYAHADTALYEVKEKGRRGCAFFNAARNSHDKAARLAPA